MKLPLFANESTGQSLEDAVRLDRLSSPLFEKLGVEVSVLRLDLIHPTISGNKWFKLRHQLAMTGQQDRLLSFGGPYSNHLHALAWAGSQSGHKTLAIVRGEPQQTPTLIDAQRWGMELHFISREAYRDRDKPTFLHQISEQFGPVRVIPEGGSNALAVKGCREIWNLPVLSERYSPDYVTLAVGSGGTLAGLAQGAPLGCTIEGVSVFADGADLEQRVRWLLADKDPRNWVIDAPIAPRYGKIDAELAALINAFRCDKHIELDAIYTVRVVKHLYRKLFTNRYPRGSQLMLVHTGGIQGNRGQQVRLNRLASAFCGPLPL